MLQLFVQFELTASLGPPAGRYPVAPIRPGRGDRDVLVIAVRGVAPARRGLVLRRARPERPGEARPVPLQLATWIRASDPLVDERAAQELLVACRADDRRADEFVDHALAQVNIAIRAYRQAALDPWLAELTRRDPRAVRIGFGTPEDIADDRWSDAFAPRPQRRGPQDYERATSPGLAVTQALRGDLALLEGEDLAGRIALDLAHDRPRAAAAQLPACLSLLAAELGPEGDTLGAAVDDASRLARLAFDDRLDGATIDELRELLDRTIDLLTRRRAHHAREEVA